MPSLTTVPTVVLLAVELELPVPPAPVAAVTGPPEVLPGPPVVPEGEMSMPSPLLTWAVHPRKATATSEPRPGRVVPRINVSSFRVTLQSCPAHVRLDRGAVFPLPSGFFQATSASVKACVWSFPTWGVVFVPPLL